MIRRAACVAGALAALGCRSPTEITVEVTTDLTCDHLSGTGIAVGSSATLKEKDLASVTTHCEGGRIGALVVVPNGDDGAEVAIRVVSGLNGKSADACVSDGFRGGCIVARRALNFVPHASLRVPVVMRDACIDTPCDAPGALATCVLGQCVPAKIPDPSACAGSGCGEGSLGGGADAGLDAAADATIEAGADAALDASRDGESDAGADADAGAHIPTWVPMASSSSVGLAPRLRALAVWTGARMLVWGGAVQTSFGNDGASYDPALDRWELLPTTQLNSRAGGTAVWTGTEMIIWGGAPISSNSARYNPSIGAWTILPAAPIAPRYDHTAVWSTTTNEMIVWGGDNDTDTVADGAAYSPSAAPGQEWRVLEASPLTKRAGHSAVWNGTTMVVFGGFGCGSWCGDAAEYDPVAKSWKTITNVPTVLDARATPAALRTGPSLTLATFFAGQGSGGVRATGATYDRSTGAWSSIDGLGTVVLPKPTRTRFASAWGAGRLWIWGGYGDDVSTDARDEGASFDPATRTWASMPPGGPSARGDMSYVWTGTEMIIWGGRTGGDTLLDDGKRFRP
jgi:N-acetylneuraminic acid mutarotase